MSTLQSSPGHTIIHGKTETLLIMKALKKIVPFAKSIRQYICSADRSPSPPSSSSPHEDPFHNLPLLY